MSAGIKANNDGSGAIQVGGSDYITISAAGAVAVPQTLAVTGATTLTGALSVPTIKSNAVATPPTVQDSAGTEIGTFCRAWVNFDGAAVTNPASMTGVRGSFNVSSILDNGLGDYTINFTTAMPDANYNAVGGGYTTASGNARGLGNFLSTTVSSFRYQAVYVSSIGGAGVANDGQVMQFSVFR